MRLHRLQLTNFRQHLDTAIDFDVGLTGIIGPNGSGKTTLLEAIAWALYGNPAARGTREGIRAHKAPARAGVSVELDFELGPHRYVVHRGLSSAELFLDGGSAPIATSISAVSDVLRRRLGMNHEEFFNTYFTGQKELSVMASMGPAERAQFLSRVLGYERLRGAQTLARDQRKLLLAEAAGLQAALPDDDMVTRALADAKTALNEARRRALAATTARDAAKLSFDAIVPAWQQLQRNRELVQALDAERQVIAGERASVERDIERLDAELSVIESLRAERLRIESELIPLATVKAELENLDRAYAEHGRRQAVEESVRALAVEAAQLGERRAQLVGLASSVGLLTADLDTTRREHEQVAAEHERVRTDWVRDKQEAETKRQHLIDQHRDVTQQREQIVELGEGGICPTCARPLGDHFRSVLDTLDAQLATITVDGKYYRARIEQLARAPEALVALDGRRAGLAERCTTLERQLATARLAADDLDRVDKDLADRALRAERMAAELAREATPYDSTRHAQLRERMAVLNALVTEAARLMARLEREPQLRVERADATARQLRVAERAVDADQRRAAVIFSEEAFTETRTRHDRLVADLRSAELESVAADAAAASAGSAHHAAERALADLRAGQAKLSKLNAEKRLHDELDRAYTDLRTDLNHQLRPEISDLASGFLTELTDGRYTELELDESYAIRVLEDGIPKPVISGGEEDLANLALRLAISQMIADRAGQPFSLLILDEVFGSLDDAHRHNVLDLLRRLQDRFEQVILISHIESVRDGLDHVVAVEYDEATGTARVRSEAAPPLEHLVSQVGAA